MVRITAAALVIVMGLSAAHEADLVDATVSGTWFNPQRSGEGWMIQAVAPDTVIIDWLTYPPANSSDEQVWIYGVGRIHGSSILIEDAFTVEGLDFTSEIAPAAIPLTPWGSYTISFQDCDNAVVDYTARPGYGAGSIAIQRLTSIAGLPCADSTPLARGETLAEQAAPGSWVHPDRLGQGWLLENSGNGLTLMTWFTHRDGRPAWLFGQGFFDGATVTMLDVVITDGGVFGPGFDATQVQRLRWGDLQMRFTDCDNGLLLFNTASRDFGSGEFAFERATGIEGLPCDARLSAPEPARTSGSWAAGGRLPTDRSEVAVAGLHGRAYVYGGFGANRRALERFDPTTGSFDLLPDAPVRRHHAMLVGHGDSLFLFGGLGDSPAAVYAFDPIRETWSRRADLPRGTFAGAAVSFGSKIFIVGGQPTVSFLYDPATDAYESLPLPPAIGWDHSNAVRYEGEIWLVAGRDFRQVHNSVQIFNPVTRTWRQGPALRNPRSGYAIGVHDGQIYVAGGEVFSPGNTVRTTASAEAYSPVTGWQAAPDLPTAVHGVQGAVLSGRFYLFGGATVGGAENPGGVGVQVYTP